MILNENKSKEILINESQSVIVKMDSSGLSGSLLKYVSLVLLTVQNAVFILSMRYVRTRAGDMFFTTTAVILQEAIKCLISMIIILVQERSVFGWLRHLHENIVLQPLDCVKVSLPSLVYMLQNNLIFIAVSNLDAAVFQVTYQLKILTTAVLSVIMLKKVLSRIQWGALVILFVGVSVVQLQPEDTHKVKVTVDQNPLVGLAAVITACVMSGFAGVYFEKILKGTQQSVWLRNVQLGGFGAFVGYITMELSDGQQVREKGFFHGYDEWVWFVILLQSGGGLIVAVVVKYADNILKGFATSASIIISCIGSIFFFGFSLSLEFCAGASLVIISTYLYSKYVPSNPKSPILPTAQKEIQS
ncbi:UDP-galactose translocator-like [Dreissena polymorpha]|uniref:UDP-galactose translocator-like n=1 Tax=Dreissena polymorpha TaxID=45954 RepID=UPI00226512A6|nr:UDP-galactose translocator-like [Dreissena polymorpha]